MRSRKPKSKRKRPLSLGGRGGRAGSRLCTAATTSSTATRISGTRSSGMTSARPLVLIPSGMSIRSTSTVTPSDVRVAPDRCAAPAPKSVSPSRQSARARSSAALETRTSQPATAVCRLPRSSLSAVAYPIRSGEISSELARASRSSTRRPAAPRSRLIARALARVSAARPDSGAASVLRAVAGTSRSSDSPASPAGLAVASRPPRASGHSS
jgi:hypothetical protein